MTKFTNLHHTPEIQALLGAVEKTFGRSVGSSSGFETLSYAIENKTGNYLSTSTLKRLWCYINEAPAPRVSTLDILSQFVGFRTFRQFCENRKNSAGESSDFFTGAFLNPEELTEGDLVEIGWDPNRLVRLEYLGNFRFKVLLSENSKLREGDEFSLASVICGYPLYIDRILRDGNATSSYVAGKNGGITVARIVS